MSPPLRIAIVGYGKMGKRIDAIAQERGHEVVARLGKDDDLRQLIAQAPSVVIEFTSPEAAMFNFEALLNMNLPVVTGTTGWLDEQDTVRQLTENHNGSFLWGSNFSIGVNVMFQLNRRLAELMNGHDQYDPFVEERHHRYKKDSPSGTARTIAEDIVERLERKTSFVLSDA
ncbi:MAG: 4-hydroxy-tetrahydrodipicolinate reductase, partial [Bacteroidota bacterium]